MLRVKIDMATRWQSVYNMVQRLVILRIAVEMWYVKYGRDASAPKLTDLQWG